jgi:hypothetical protein
MRTISQSNMLLRAQTELPDGLRMATDEFHDGWNFLPTVNARRLEEQIVKRGWSCLKISKSSPRCGVGDTSQEAIASALKLALHRISEHFNAAEVEHIELTQYPWFFLARVSVCPFRIQHDAILPSVDESAASAVAPRQRRLPLSSAALYPDFASAMPMLKEMLISSRSAQARIE